MHYEPREGVDFIIDLYQVAEVASDIDKESVKRALNERLLEYHPDRLQGLAPEFQRAGERMAQVLNRAKVILLDDERRAEYDEILTSWTGPVSKDGTPVIRMDDAIRAEASQKTSDQLEIEFSDQAIAIASIVKHNPKQQDMLGRMLKTAGENEDASELRDAYDDALLAEDQVLAIEEAERSRLIGIPENNRYETSLGYADTIHTAIEKARAVQAEEHQRRTVGGVSMRLALLSGESTSEQLGNDIIISGQTLPHYFEEQVTKVKAIAAHREELLRKRLEIFQPTYPVEEIQSESHPNFLIGIATNADSTISTWIGFNFNANTVELSNIKVPEQVKALLTSAEYAEVYSRGYNILTFAMKDQIKLETLLEEAYNKHLVKYFHDAMNA